MPGKITPIPSKPGQGWETQQPNAHVLLQKLPHREDLGQWIDGVISPKSRGSLASIRSEDNQSWSGSREPSGLEKTYFSPISQSFREAPGPLSWTPKSSGHLNAAGRKYSQHETLQADSVQRTLDPLDGP